MAKFEVKKMYDYTIEIYKKGSLYRSSALTLGAATNACKRMLSEAGSGKHCFIDKRVRSVKRIGA